MRRVSILAVLALLALIAVPIADAAVAKPLMTVEGNVIVAFDPDPDFQGMWRFEIRTTEAAKVEFGYFQTQGLSGGGHSQATVESVRFFTAPSGGRGAEFTGTECGPTTVSNAASDWECNPSYVVQVVDNAGRGVPDTACGGTVIEPCAYPYTVIGGDIRIFSQQQR